MDRLICPSPHNASRLPPQSFSAPCTEADTKPLPGHEQACIFAPGLAGAWTGEKWLFLCEVGDQHPMHVMVPCQICRSRKVFSETVTIIFKHHSPKVGPSCDVITGHLVWFWSLWILFIHWSALSFSSMCAVWHARKRSRWVWGRVSIRHVPVSRSRDAQKPGLCLF